ncbi:SMP-30/gluconolactonase/LRE family protein [Sphingomonas sp. BIUV-7]|uniref:SMP-30/gluconolactonase/LRE family protein n=1 Tax=Sphingomonas natans TaxID=3063330 RepID=A0ABT8Y6T4_9SPHN|nr:SMP-30/gluconolactonase/LRE family protein [Sphingomonas sp. BIUV-7]MDO6414041.1 SMP-30/gluconolactonase/LRE family protein [Sphingomonas sp. BIUV-7]
MIRLILGGAATIVLAAGFGSAEAASRPSASLSYTDDTRGLAPIPMSERGLPQAVAEPYFKVSDKAMPVEGPAFDRGGNLYFHDIAGGHLMCLTPERQLSTVFTDATLFPSGTAINIDGMIYIAGIGRPPSGRVLRVNPKDGRAETILPASGGYAPNDMVLDADGGIYFTDFRGSATVGSGGVYYISPADHSVKTVIPNIGMGNGVALSPDGKVLWATEYATERLLRAELSGPGTISRVHATYYFTGRGPDSMRTDVDGNVYVTMTQQGRVLVFNQNGVPIGQILIPGREAGHFLRVSSLAFVPGTRELRILAWDERGDGGTMIFRAQGLAPGVTLYSHR